MKHEYDGLMKQTKHLEPQCTQSAVRVREPAWYRSIDGMVGQPGGNPWVEQLLQWCHVNEVAVSM
jgi:hypothetical protein